jgi:prepilin-type N-terminal cleavage/methylation domain-containing protein
MNATQMKNQGFTLVELLVVVAIIAVIGAGVAVTYQRLDDKAKTAVEMSDIATLKKVVKHWGAINDYKIPNELDSLVAEDGKLYSQMYAQGPMTGVDPAGDATKGLYGPAGYTFMVHPAPTNVVQNLAACGMTDTYIHLLSSANANDSTFEIGTGMSEGSLVDTTRTRATLVLGGSATYEHARAIVDAPAPTEYPATIDGEEFTDEAAYLSALADAEATLEAPEVDKLAFIYPGGGVYMMGQPMAMNATEEIISNAGLKPEEVAVPGEDDTGKKCYLVAMGFGRFSSIYRGKAVRADAPATGKRQAKSLATYSRYIGIFRVPVATYSSMTGAGQPAELVDVLSPQGYSVAALGDNYIDDERKVKD